MHVFFQGFLSKISGFLLSPQNMPVGGLAILNCSRYELVEVWMCVGGVIWWTSISSHSHFTHSVPRNAQNPPWTKNQDQTVTESEKKKTYDFVHAYIWLKINTDAGIWRTKQIKVVVLFYTSTVQSKAVQVML